MKIKEASVIDNKVIDEMIEEYEKQMDNIFITESLSIFMEGQLSALKHIKSHSKPLTPIIKDAVMTCRLYRQSFLLDEYINETEI